MFLNKLKSQFDRNQPLFIGEETAYRSAVLIPLVLVDNEWSILFEVRSFALKRQPGDISFPGGRIDETDESPLAAAIRETSEELGVDPTSIHIVGQLSPYVVSPSFIIYPFVATIEYSQVSYCYNQEEVEEVFTIPIKWLLDYEPYRHTLSVQLAPLSDFPFEKIVNGSNYQWQTRSMEEWFFDYDKYTIWGLTASILKYFVEMIADGDRDTYKI